MKPVPFLRVFFPFHRDSRFLPNLGIADALIMKGIPTGQDDYSRGHIRQFSGRSIDGRNQGIFRILPIQIASIEKLAIAGRIAPWEQGLSKGFVAKLRGG